MLELPQFFRVQQHFERPQVADIPGTVEAELARLNLRDKVRPGQTVAVTCGSRGIANIQHVIKAIVRHFLALGAKPFIVPAMGSHGGGTAEGQRAIVEGYGVTEEFCGCPIRSSMETVIVCKTEEGFNVHFDKHAFEADHVVVCGRVKPHTDFVGEVESGLMKMMLIGLGKHNGAWTYHRAIHDYSFSQIVRSVAHRVLEKCHILCGVAIVENGYDETALIGACLAQDIEEREKGWLKLARQWMPKLPFDFAHIVLVDEIGKNISGAGMDTNVLGRKFDDHKAVAGEKPIVRRIVVRGLTDATHGNASGIGLAEFALTRAIQQVDLKITQINCITSGHVSACMLPVDFATDRQVLEEALPTIGLAEPPEAKILWIRNTLTLAEVECSQAYWDEAHGRSDLTILTDLRPLPLDEQGMLPRFVTDLGTCEPAHA